MTSRPGSEDEGVTMSDTCRGCGIPLVGPIYEVPEVMYGTGERFHYQECVGCGSLTCTDVPADLAPYYPDDYLSLDVDPGSLGVVQRAAVTVVARSVLRGNGRVARLATYLPSRKVVTLTTVLNSVARCPGIPAAEILDVGSGAGMIPFTIGCAGDRDVTGIDPFAGHDRTLSPRARIRVTDIEAVDGSYDLVTMHHSLEHVLDPVGMMRDASRLLRDDGRVLVRVPTCSSDAWREYGAVWVQLDAPRHVWIPSRAGLALLAERSGFVIESGYDDGSDFQFWGSEQARAGIALMSPESYYRAPRASGFTKAQLRAWSTRAEVLNRERRGDQTVVYLRKTG
jgi:SAM-dependent methyltransferase